jgi:rfaE bifunctional protein kinase chain/domain
MNPGSPRSLPKPIAPERFQALTSRYPALRVAVLGDFCLDRYLEIDPARAELSLETGLPVHNVVRVRAQPGGAGTILNNLAALRVGSLFPVGYAGCDGEGFELCQALEQLPGVRLERFLRTPLRRTFTYCKPLVLEADAPPRELNRLDFKNWTPTPAAVQEQLCQSLVAVAAAVDALIVLDQVDIPETGVVGSHLLKTLSQLAKADTNCVMLADSRRSLRGFPPVLFKMNTAELAAFIGAHKPLELPDIGKAAVELARHNGRSVFITMAERGLLGANPAGQIEHVPALPLRGPIDVVGAGDAVSANLTVALACGASLREALELANAAASVVIHKLGTTGTASVAELFLTMKEREQRN